MWKLSVSRGCLRASGRLPTAWAAEAGGVVARVGRRLVEGELQPDGVYSVRFQSRKRVVLAELLLRRADGGLRSLGRRLCVNLGAAGGREESDLARQLAVFDYTTIPEAPATARSPRPEGPNQARDGWDLQWIVPDFHPGAGGMMSVFRLAAELERRGHRNRFWIMRGTRHTDIRAVVSRHFTPLAAEFRVLAPGELGRVRGDVVIATNDESAYFARGVGGVAAKCYLVQDYEPAFHPAGTGALFSRRTYHFGFRHIVAGAWLRAMLEREGCTQVRTWEFGFERAAYFPAADGPAGGGAGPAGGLAGSAERARTADGRKHVAFYARCSTPRRAVPLGVQALARLAARRDDLHVHLFGQSHPGLRLPFSFENHGVLGAAELGALYRRCDAGLVLSATNHSIAPLEMMASGLPVVELAGENNELIYPAGSISLASPDPDALADALARVLDDERHATRLRERGLAWASKRDWDSAAEAVESAIAESLRGAS